MNNRDHVRNSSSGLVLADWVTLAAILAVVLVVSLPRLQSLALHQNELDAIAATRMLGHSVFAMESERTLSGVLEEDSTLGHRLEDVEVLEQGRVLRRHGYLFDLTRTRDGAPALRAWPWHCGETGYGAFILTPDGGLRGHANEQSKWSGPGNAPVLPDDASEWHPIER